MKEFDTQKWCVKLKKRIRTLLMHYLFWNLCYLLFMLVVQLSFPNMVWERKMIYNYSFFELINSFWNFGGMYYGMPILYSFWFIRNLIVLNLFAPIFYFLLKKTPVISIVICLIFFIFNLSYFIVLVLFVQFMQLILLIPEIYFIPFPYFLSYLWSWLILHQILYVFVGARYC